jgi:hypothetical protein
VRIGRDLQGPLEVVLGPAGVLQARVRGGPAQRLVDLLAQEKAA